MLRRRILLAPACALLLALASTASAGPRGGKPPKPDTTAPSVAITAPSAGATLTGDFSVTGAATDNRAVAKVEVSVDGGAYSPGSSTSAWSSWSFQVATNTHADGPHLLTARASDASGNSSVATVSVTFANAPSPPPPPPPPPPDITPPGVAITLPVAGATVSGTVTVSGTASDDAAVARVEVSVDSGPYSPALGTDTWTYSLDTTGYPDGGHTIAARATDTSGNASSTSETLNVRNSTSPTVSEQMVTPEGATIQIYSDVTGWTAQQVYELLKPNALELTRIGPTLTIRLQTRYASSTLAGASETGGVYSGFRATMNLQAKPGTVFTDRPDYILAHEYGHAWTLYHLYLSQQNDWTKYLAARGIANDPRVDSTYNWSKLEMIADDYRMLFGTSAAISESFYLNPDVPDPRTVPGLRDFFLNVWAVP